MNQNQVPKPDPLDDCLRQPEEYIPDNGFTARVISALPPRQDRWWLRPAILGLAMLASSALALMLVPEPLVALQNVLVAAPEERFKVCLELAPLALALAPVFWLALRFGGEEELI